MPVGAETPYCTCTQGVLHRVGLAGRRKGWSRPSLSRPSLRQGWRLVLWPSLTCQAEALAGPCRPTYARENELGNKEKERSVCKTCCN